MPQLRRLAAALGALLLVPGCTSSLPDHLPTVSPKPGHKPSLVLVLGANLSPDLLRFMPHVVDLQRSGTTFTHYVVTGTDRTPIFTGRYPHNAAPTDQSFAVALRRAGYRTGLIGEYVAGYGPSRRPAPGWDEWDVASPTATGFGYDLNENGTVRHYRHAPGDYLTDVLAGKARDFIAAAAQDGRPYALVIAPPVPGPAIAPAPGHRNTYPGLGAPRGPAFGRLPTDPPDWLAGLPPLGGADLLRLDADYERRVEAVQSVDALIRQVGRAVQAGPFADSTYLMVSSDSGYHLGQHRLPAGSGTAFDTDIRAPLVVRGPGVAVNATVDALASGIDLAPTLEDLAGVRPAATLDGISLRPLLEGAVPAGWQPAVLVEQAGGPGRPEPPGRPPGFAAVRTANAVYIAYAGGAAEYYDLASDQYQLHNRIDTAPAAELARLQVTLAALRGCHGSARCQAAAAS